MWCEYAILYNFQDLFWYLDRAATPEPDTLLFIYEYIWAFIEMGIVIN